MIGKLIIHIGPPKTATTSLQYYWLEINKPDFKYLGIIQPRGDESFASNLYKYACSKTIDHVIENELIEICKKNLSKYRYVVISEEMFVLEDVRTPYIEKLKKLHRIFEKFQPIIIYCIRDVENIYFSYYTEIYNFLPRSLQTSFDQFQYSKYSECFRYKFMYTQLIDIGFDKINLFFFKDLVSGVLSMNEILGIEDSNYSFKVNLNKTNITRVKNSELKVRKKSRFEELIIKKAKFFPDNFRGKRFLVFLFQSLNIKINAKLKKAEISEFTKEQFNHDLDFLKSLKKKG